MNSSSIVKTLLDLPVFHAEWVLYLLLTLSVASAGVILERWWFYQRCRVNTDGIRRDLESSLDRYDFATADLSPENLA